MFAGSYVALITPMTASGKLDKPALRKLVAWHIQNGTQGLVPAGTTGESPVLSGKEHRKVIRIVVEEANGRIPVIAGCGSNNTSEAVAFHDYAHKVGADGALHVTGYYNRPSQEGIFRHFEVLSRSNTLPIIVYNIPARAIVDISPDTMSRLAALPTVVGVKDATTDLARPAMERVRIQEDFSYLSGEDGTAVAYNAAGGNGCISVTANVAPTLCARLQKACAENDFLGARKIQNRLMPLHEALFIEPSPAGIKYACSRLGLCSEVLRLPMVGLNVSTRLKIDAALLGLNLT